MFEFLLARLPWFVYWESWGTLRGSIRGLGRAKESRSILLSPVLQHFWVFNSEFFHGYLIMLLSRHLLISIVRYGLVVRRRLTRHA